LPPSLNSEQKDELLSNTTIGLYNTGELLTAAAAAAAVSTNDLHHRLLLLSQETISRAQFGDIYL
jgi:hypothetical protein